MVDKVKPFVFVEGVNFGTLRQFVVSAMDALSRRDAQDFGIWLCAALSAVITESKEEHEHLDTVEQYVRFLSRFLERATAIEAKEGEKGS